MCDKSHHTFTLPKHLISIQFQTSSEPVSKALAYDLHTPPDGFQRLSSPVWQRQYTDFQIIAKPETRPVH